MRILTALTYYRPHTSGLTIYAERLARALVQRGHEVTILAMRHDRSLPAESVDDGVRVVRAPVLARISKGALAPAFLLAGARLTREADAVHLHLPQFDAAGIALLGRLRRLPVVVTYHCDLRLPSGALNRMAEAAVHALDNLAGCLAHRVVTYTQDYGDNSRYLRRFRRKLAVVPPPVVLPPADAAAVARFRAERLPPGKGPVIAMAARMAAEKGVEVLLDAFPRILAAHPDACIVFAGQYRDVLGEGAYFARLQPRIDALARDDRWRFLGVLDMAEMAAFYACVDLLAVPSLNSTESFGLVQIEAMINGVPAVASDLPGVRHAVRSTGMGGVFPVGDAQALALAALAALDSRGGRRVPRPDLAAEYDPLRAAQRYEALFRLPAAHHAIRA